MRDSLPRDERARARALAEKGELVLEGLRVLVVDGDEEAADRHRRFLSELTADVRTAVLGHAAAALVGPAWIPHVLVTELHLPDMDGERLARIVGRRGGHAVATIAVTADARRSVARAACDRGFSRCLVKPVDRYDLTSAVFVTARSAGMPIP